MPRAIVTTDGMTYRLTEYELPSLAPDEVRIRVTFAAPKHGTEKHAISGSPFDRKRWDPELRMFLPREEAPQAAPGERGIGNMVVGEVIACGSEVTRCLPGDRVFGYGPIREVHQLKQTDVWLCQSMSDADCVCVDPAHVAFVAVRDGNIRIGDTVAVYGLGAIGLMAVQIARAGGARRVYAVDPIAIRREAAMRLGADASFDPRACDAALEIKRSTGGAGVDVSIETSGSGAALHDAIRCIRQCGVIVHVPWGPHDCSDLHLDEEFHLNRPTIVGSQAWSGWGCADRSHPLWTHERAFEATIELFRAGLITGQGVVEPVVPLDRAPEALAAIFSAPETTIKVGVRL
ncbi:MAG: zinc-binding dehydrogenase [Chthonomonadales bacterium]|nr:zinc-binding dehydrogenase [Chthonomonadales bacterium]